LNLPCSRDPPKTPPRSLSTVMPGMFTSNDLAT
jgi:hypothetical protein